MIVLQLMNVVLNLFIIKNYIAVFHVLYKIHHLSF